MERTRIMNNEKKTYQTPEAEVILFGEDVITCSGDYMTDILPDYESGF